MWHVRPQGTEESYLTVMLAKFIAQIKTRNVTEQSVMVSSYPSGEILSARRKPHTAVTVGASTVTNSRLPVKKGTRDESNFGPIFNPQ